MREKLIEILSDIRPEIDFEEEDHLMEDGLLDSLDIANIITAMCDEFEVDIGFDEVKKDNFDSLEAMLKLLESYK